MVELGSFEEDAGLVDKPHAEDWDVSPERCIQDQRICSERHRPACKR